MGWSQDDFDFATPRYLFNAYRGRYRFSMEQSRFVALLSSKIHSPKALKVQDFGLFPWEDEADYLPKFSPLDPDAMEYFKNAEFKPLPNQAN